MMMGYYVACPRCANQLFDDGQMSGCVVVCPHCQQQFQMPVPQVVRVASNEPTSPEPIEVRVSSRRTRSAMPAGESNWIVSGYVATVMSIVFFPACIPGLVIGSINVIRGSIGHGLVQVAVALAIIALIIQGQVEDAEYWSKRALTDPIVERHQDELASEATKLQQQLELVDDDERIRAIDRAIKEASPAGRSSDFSSKEYRAQEQTWNELLTRRQFLKKSVEEELRTKSDQRKQEIDRRYQRMYDKADFKRDP